MSPMAMLLMVSESQQTAPMSVGIHRCHTASDPTYRCNHLTTAYLLVPVPQRLHTEIHIL